MSTHADSIDSQFLAFVARGERHTAWREIEGGAQRVRAQFGFDLTRNAEPYFAVTAEVQDKTRGGWRGSSWGCQHEVVERAFPELAKSLRWHLTSRDAGPMHYEANAVYQWKQYIGSLNIPNKPAMPPEPKSVTASDPPFAWMHHFGRMMHAVGEANKRNMEAWHLECEKITRAWQERVDAPKKHLSCFKSTVVFGAVEGDELPGHDALLPASDGRSHLEIWLEARKPALMAAFRRDVASIDVAALRRTASAQDDESSISRLAREDGLSVEITGRDKMADGSRVYKFTLSGKGKNISTTFTAGSAWNDGADPDVGNLVQALVSDAQAFASDTDAESFASNYGDKDSIKLRKMFLACKRTHGSLTRMLGADRLDAYMSVVE